MVFNKESRDAGRGRAVAISPDGQLRASGGDKLDLFGVSSAEPVNRFSQGATICIQFSPDGKYLASGNGNGNVRILHLQSDVESVYRDHERGVGCVTFSPDGQTLISFGEGQAAYPVCIRDVQSGESYGVWEGPKLEVDHRLYPQASISTAKGRMILVAAGLPTKLAVWELASLEP